MKYMGKKDLRRTGNLLRLIAIIMFLCQMALGAAFYFVKDFNYQPSNLSVMATIFIYLVGMEIDLSDRYKKHKDEN